MDTFIQADIFFFVTTIFVIILVIVLAIAGFYIIRILRNLRDVSEIVKSETQHIAGDVENLRSDLKRTGFSLPLIFGFFKRVLGQGNNRKTHN
jgi:hypothetical protein